MSLLVHSVETFGTHDGPGIRLVVFTQGCYFACAYCHNPDSRALVSPEAREYSNQEIIALLEKQKPYFKDSGGLTVSGGEPTVQVEALLDLFGEVREAGFHITLDTCGAIYSQKVRELYDQSDLVMLDVKHIDDDWHQKLTGKSNQTVLQNAAYREESGKPMWLRYVLVPGWTDQPEHLEAWAAHFRDYQTIAKVEILPYHLLGVHKYERLGIPYRLKDVPAATHEQARAAQEIFSKYLKNVVIN